MHSSFLIVSGDDNDDDHNFNYLGIPQATINFWKDCPLICVLVWFAKNWNDHTSRSTQVLFPSVQHFWFCFNDEKLKPMFNKKTFLPLGHRMKSPRTSTSAFVTWRRQQVMLDMVTLKRSDICLQLSWLARAQTVTAISLRGWIQGFPNLLALGMWSLADRKWLSISEVDEVMPKWLLKTSQW